MTNEARIEVCRVGPVVVPLPAYQTSGSVGLDLCAALGEPVTLEPGARRLIPTGLALAIPSGFEGQVRPRSGWALKDGVTVLNSPGTIDSDYRGEVGIVLINHGDRAIVIEPLARIAQLVVSPVVRATLECVAALDVTSRAGGGYGSTGR